MEEFRKIHPNFYYDDGKPEYPSEPHNNLEELILELKEVLGQVQDICDKNDWIYSSIGCHPFASSFASFHIHSSLNKIPKYSDILLTKKYLLDLQPYIALLSQNSPALCGARTPYKDIRLAFSHWSKFTENAKENHSHYMSLAEGRHGHGHVDTLECRIPSSCSLHQAEAVLVFIKTMIELANQPVLPISRVQTVFYRVIKWGGQALVPLTDSSTINFLGVGKEVLVPISELFRLFLEDEIIQPVFKEVVEELPSEDREKIKEYYKIIASGLTPSDFMLKLCETYNWNNKAISEAIGEITMESYLHSIPFWKLTPYPSQPELPKIKEIYSLEEALKLVKKRASSVKYKAIEDLDYILYTSKYSIRTCSGTRVLLRNFIKQPTKALRLFELDRRNLSRGDSKRILDFLVRRKILEAKAPEDWTSEVRYKAGKKFPYVIQLAREGGLI